MKNIDSILEDLNKILNNRSEDIVAVIEVLGREEIKYLKRKLNILTETADNKNYYEDILLKSEAIDSIIIFLSNHAAFKEFLQDRETERQELLSNLHSISYDLRKIYFLYACEHGLPNRFYTLIAGVCNGILAEQISNVDCFIREHKGKIEYSLERTSHMSKLEKQVGLIILLLLKRIANLHEKKEIEQELSLVEKQLERIQQDEIDNDSMEVQNGILIGGFANIIFVLKSVFKYLVSGQIENGESIESVIKTYMFNAIKLFEKSNQDMARIANLLVYTLIRLCANSIWEMASRAPADIRKFLERSTRDDNNIILSFLPSQRQKISELLTARRSIVINMPTSAGKTMLAEIYILFTMQAYAEFEGNKIKRPTICYIVPTNALINQTRKKLAREFEGTGFRIEGALPFYEIDEIEEEILTKHPVDILITTPEKLDFLVRRDHPVLERLRLVVVDEAHQIANPTRGAKLELLLAILKQKRKDVNFLLISPFIKNAKQISRWLGNTEADSADISIEWTPTKQYVGICKDNKKEETTEIIYFPTPTNRIIEDEIEIDLGTYSKSKKKKLNLSDKDRYRAKSLILLEKYFNIGNFMILCGGPGSAKEMAELCLKHFKTRLEPTSGFLIDKAIALIRLESGNDEDPLIKCIRRGIIYHHAQLYNPVKEVIEELIATGLVKIVCATTTLAQGMNFPITSIIFTTLSLGGGRNKRMMEPEEFWNIAGRAGRAFKDSEGHIIATTQKDGRIINFIKNRTIEVLSSLSSFFDQLDEAEEFKLNLIAKKQGASEFLQYLNHILRVAYKYDLDNVDTAKLRNILNTSLAFREMEFKSGFLESQEKIRRFSQNYIQHMTTTPKNVLQSADAHCLSDISFSFFVARVKELIDNLKSQHGENYSNKMVKASEIIIQSKSIEELSPIIEVISGIPEMKLYILGQGQLIPEQIAKIVIHWVNGSSIRDISEKARFPNEPPNAFLEKCIQYINSRLTTFLPWGMSVYQQLTNDQDTKAATNLPSYIYYGVNSADLVILSRLGLPRFAIRRVKQLLNRKHPDLPLTVSNMNEVKKEIQSLDSNDYNFSVDGKLVKDIIDRSL